MQKRDDKHGMIEDKARSIKPSSFILHPSSFILPNHWPLIITLLLALGLRVLLWSAPLHQPANDEVEYITVARDLLAGRGWQFYAHYHWLRAPLYPLWLAGSLWLAGGDLHRAALPNIALSVANVYLGYRLTLALAGRRAAALAALIGAILWTFVTFASLYMAETLFTFCFTAGLICLVGPTTGYQPPTTNAHPRLASAFTHRQAVINEVQIGRLTTIGCGGVLFGLATLTRSIALLFLPVVAVWLIAHHVHHKGTKRTEGIRNTRTFVPSVSLWFYPAVFLLAAVLTIAPWTIRNYAAYGRLIPVETGLSYNLWVFNEPRESGDAIFRTLENIANPAERSDYASAKGLARLREDPAILLRKLWPNWVYLVRVKPIEDRFLQENYYSDVDLPRFSAALTLDDALYLLVALAGIAGLVAQKSQVRSQKPGVASPRPELNTQHSALKTLGQPRWLLIAWLLYAIGTMLLTHGEARYRHFLFPVLIPYAVWALTERVRQGDKETRRKANLLVSLSPCLLIYLMWALVAGTFLAYYPWGWAGQNVARGWYVVLSESAWRRGDQAAAIAADERALAAQETLDGWLRLGDHARAAGDPRRALNAYNAARTLTRSYLPQVAKLGDFLRESGDEAKARAVFRTDDVDQQQLVDWSWRELRPAPRTALAVGDGLDFGYLSGVYPAEAIGGVQARWTNGHAMLRLGTASGGRALVRLRLAAPWPSGAPATHICAGSQCWTLQLTPGWRTYTVAFATVGDAPLVVELRSSTFEASDGRHLGVLVDQVTLMSAQ